jgi:hypothetical protein
MTELEAGRALDALIEERIFGNPVDDEFEEPIVKARRDQYDEWGVLPFYSTDLTTAWEIVTRLEAHSLEWHLSLYRMHDDDDRLLWFADFSKQRSDYAPVGSNAIAAAETPALAICRAALRVVGAE